MNPRISLITVTVDDLEKSLSFYRDGLSQPTQGIIGTEFEIGTVAFYDLESKHGPSAHATLYFFSKDISGGSGTMRSPPTSGWVRAPNAITSSSSRTSSAGSRAKM